MTADDFLQLCSNIGGAVDDAKKHFTFSGGRDDVRLLAATDHADVNGRLAEDVVGSPMRKVDLCDCRDHFRDRGIAEVRICGVRRLAGELHHAGECALRRSREFRFGRLADQHVFRTEISERFVRGLRADRVRLLTDDEFRSLVRRAAG